MHSDDCFDIVCVWRGGGGRKRDHREGRMPLCVTCTSAFNVRAYLPCCECSPWSKTFINRTWLVFTFYYRDLNSLTDHTLLPVKRLASELSLMLEANSGIRYRQWILVRSVQIFRPPWAVFMERREVVAYLPPQPYKSASWPLQWKLRNTVMPALPDVFPLHSASKWHVTRDTTIDRCWSLLVRPDLILRATLVCTKGQFRLFIRRIIWG